VPYRADRNVLQDVTEEVDNVEEGRFPTRTRPNQNLEIADFLPDVLEGPIPKSLDHANHAAALTW